MNPCFGRTVLPVDHTTEERGLASADAARVESAAPRLQRLLYCPEHTPVCLAHTLWNKKSTNDSGMRYSIGGTQKGRHTRIGNKIEPAPCLTTEIKKREKLSFYF